MSQKSSVPQVTRFVQQVLKRDRAVNAALADQEFNARLTNLGVEPFANTPAEFGKFIVEYTDKWAKVIRAAGLKAE